MLRKKIFFKAVIYFFGLFFIGFSAFSQDAVTIATYYPSPQGLYNQVVVAALGVGDNNAPAGLDNLDVPIAGDVWIGGDVGIGTTNPQSRLSVAGSAAIGATYAGVTAAPANGLLVQGDVGVGVDSPDFTTGSDIAANHIRFVSTNEPNSTVEGALYYDTADNLLKYFDDNDESTPAKSLGKGQLRPDQTVTVVSDNVEAHSPAAEGARAACAEGSVMTGVELYVPCNIGESANDCSVSTETQFFRIERVHARCTPLQ